LNQLISKLKLFLPSEEEEETKKKIDVPNIEIDSSISEHETKIQNFNKETQSKIKKIINKFSKDLEELKREGKEEKKEEEKSTEEKKEEKTSEEISKENKSDQEVGSKKEVVDEFSQKVYLLFNNCLDELLLESAKSLAQFSVLAIEQILFIVQFFLSEKSQINLDQTKLNEMVQYLFATEGNLSIEISKLSDLFEQAMKFVAVSSKEKN